MASSEAITATLPRFIVIKSKAYSDKGNVHFKSDGRSVVVGEEDVLSTPVKIEVERSTTNAKYVNLRFVYFNRYWQRKENDKFIVAESDQPEEDVTNSSCTLFEPVKVDDNGVFYLSHVQSGGRLSVDGQTMALYVDEQKNGDEEKGYLTFVDWNTLVKMPGSVAFKGSNGKYIMLDGSLLLFKSDDPNDKTTICVVEQKPEGHVHIRQREYDDDYFWAVRTPELLVSGVASSLSPPSTQLYNFWPVIMDDNTIALRSEYNNNFCCYLYDDYGIMDGLWARASTVTKDAILQVHESVVGRKIYNVVYQMEYARIFDEVPYLAGSETLTNDGDKEDSMAVSIEYTDEKSYTFSRSISLTAGVSASIEAGIPFIEKATIQVHYEISGALQWDETTTTTTSVTATGTVPIPAKTKATVDYVGTRGTCNIPYSYTQEDKSSIDGKPIYTDLVDGIYTGVSYYNFNFHVRDTMPL
ncbi:hypothetical protein SASPL_110089 [Salvia splendens]|uniref:Agglutinin domain-containing protein n=1 Tax=Salvia splendens TaxID=180675 RepID=A0A8X8YA07_SALSN|nr:uncharacterized protein LOC121797798 [Salvia splendens]KAG6425881.1 hypothetical protein SASPL_110089 [Salvia splendens]